MTPAAAEAAPARELAPQDLVLSLLGAHVTHREHAAVWSGGLVALLAEFDFSAGAARIALARMVHRGLLARHRNGRLVSYTLTDRAVAILAEGDRRIFSFGREPVASTTWTVLWQAIPEQRRQARERLVRRLRFLGFGSLQDGTWLAPHDKEREVAALLAELDVAEHAGVLLGRPAALVGFDAVLSRAWDLAGLAARYAAFVGEFAGYADPAARASLDDRAALVLRTRLVHLFRQFPSLDPELPADVADPPPDRAAAVALFHDLYPALAEPAGRHFREVTSHE
ncbi:MAG TPA: PaaX family transcriptional regulator C-terminal domain-containing protein [Pseudonocardiaceae bacterium]|jgi:phenylacetic acid degradation operon negative regulatory protein|nr:PaaX family transcriptional regulator C-terminal domain-containing protein [Pseudonocardiaceae bacterium]